MNKLTTEEDVFQALLEGQDERVSPDLARMAKIVQTLQVQPSRMRPGFRTGLRKRLTTEASTVDEVDVFNVILEEADFVAGPTPMAKMATLAKAIPAQPSPMRAGFRAELRTKIIAEAERPISLTDRIKSRAEQARERIAARNASMRRSLRVVAAVAAATMVLGGAGAVFAAAEKAAWGDVLYPVDRWREQASLAFTFGDAPKGKRLLEIARERTIELYTLTDRGTSEGGPFVATLGLLDETTVDASTRIVRAFREDQDRELIGALQDFADQQKLDLTGLVDQMPASARPAALDSIALVDRVKRQADNIVKGCPCPENPLAPSTTAAGSGNQTGEEPSCACEPQSQSGLGDKAKENDDGNGNGGGNGGNTPEPPPPPPPPPDDELIPDVGVEPVDGVGDDAEDLIEDILPTEPSVPSGTPSLPT